VRFQPPADRPHPFLAQFAVVRRRAHLDELVRLERSVDLREHLVRESLVADDHDRIELVRLSAQLAAA